ncbi:hypothetical protein QR680_004062 [Steinernema hermaphroditum]|uniref:Uncharacterized protein n=1 Tax=Steinernema hermaphroditum TaxID=289476 RepID=A0AA39HNY8_9BILA|nr:hypothetical protein QR680_004062 [Steinernema hermaphroditum]
MDCSKPFFKVLFEMIDRLAMSVERIESRLSTLENLYFQGAETCHTNQNLFLDILQELSKTVSIKRPATMETDSSSILMGKGDSATDYDQVVIEKTDEEDVEEPFEQPPLQVDKEDEPASHVLQEIPHVLDKVVHSDSKTGIRKARKGRKLGTILEPFWLHSNDNLTIAVPRQKRLKGSPVEEIDWNFFEPTSGLYRSECINEKRMKRRGHSFTYSLRFFLNNCTTSQSFGSEIVSQMRSKTDIWNYGMLMVEVLKRTLTHGKYLEVYLSVVRSVIDELRQQLSDDPFIKVVTGVQRQLAVIRHQLSQEKAACQDRDDFKNKRHLENLEIEFSHFWRHLHFGDHCLLKKSLQSHLTKRRFIFMKPNEELFDKWRILGSYREVVKMRLSSRSNGAI